MTRRKERPIQLGGLLDWLDIFGTPKEKPKQGGLPALPAPRASKLPALREERGLIPGAPRKSIKEKLLSIFDFGPPKKAKEKQELIEPKPHPLDFFEASPEEEEPLYEAFASSKTRYESFQPQTRREEQWGFPGIEEMAAHLSRNIDLDRVFQDLARTRETEEYQDSLADAAFNDIPLYTPISHIDDTNFYTDFADFYGIPMSIVESMPSAEAFRSELLNPMNILLGEAFEMLKPDYLSGFFTVDYNSEDGKYWLYYVEPWIGRLPGP